MDSAAATASVPHPLAPEDQARANFYALLARLFAAAPDAALLRAIAAAAPLGIAVDADPGADTDEPEAAGPRLPAAWDSLRAASAAVDAEAVAQEYTDLFIGVGKSEINLHASHWLAGHMMDRPLVEVRATLARAGLAPRPETTMLEDHLSALCEAMRALITGQGLGAPASLPTQREFFENHMAPWVFACCNAIGDFPVANYYARVAQFAGQYMALERDSFAID
jgi:TorA maturation chaperone TorD